MDRHMKAEQFTVRLAEPDEEPAIAALVVEGFVDKFRSVYGRRMDRSVRIMEKWIRLEHLSGGVTSPGFRRQGMARRLLVAAEDFARDAGKTTVGLHVSGHNLPALRLYENEGYEEVSRQHSYLTGYFLNIRDWLYLKKEL